MTKPMKVTCNESCNKTFALTKFLTQKLDGGIEKVYFVCPHCLHQYVAYYTNAEIRNLQEKIRNVDRRIGKPHYDQKVANKMHAKLKGQIVEKMTGLRGMVEKDEANNGLEM